MSMNTHIRIRVLSWLLVLAMVLTMVPTVVLAEDSDTYTKISSLE